MAISNTLFFPSSLAVPRTLAHPALSPPLPTFASSFVNRAPLTLATKLICIQPAAAAAADGADTTVDSTSTKSMKVSDDVPMPIVLIDQDSDYDSTVVQLSFGDRLGALLDTINTLKDLGLKVTKGSVTTKGSVKQTKLFITRRDNGRKVEDPELLEEIRLSIINNLLQYHPESSELLALGEAFGIKSPKKKVIPTHVKVINDGSRRSLLIIETADRPGLLLEILEIIADINVKVESAEIETEGLVAKDKFHVSYGGAALTRSLSQVANPFSHLIIDLKLPTTPTTSLQVYTNRFLLTACATTLGGQILKLIVTSLAMLPTPDVD